MQAHLKIESPEYPDLNKVIAWFIRLRWIACGGVFVSLLVVYFILQYELPFRTLFTFNFLLGVANTAFVMYYRYIKQGNLSRKEIYAFLNIQVCCDYALLFFLIYFAGFLENPFLYYFVFHIMLTSFMFSPGATFVYVCSLVTLIISLSVAEYYQFIPHFYFGKTGEFSSYRELIFLRTTGFCSTLFISAYLITSIKKRLEEKGKRVEVELNRYKSLDKAKSNFILQVTHELRGPLAALKGFHDMILKGIAGKADQRARDIIIKANRRTGNLLTIIDEMIDYAYMKSEQEVRYTKTEINLKQAIDYNLELFYSQAKQKNIRLSSACPEQLTVWASRDLVNIILSNLITNAIKYSHQGSQVLMNAEPSGDQVHILVKDQGIGIEGSELENIFEEFYRTRRAREVIRDGTGLGLSIVKKAVDSLGGKISVYSEKDRGTTFHIYVPGAAPVSTTISGG
ncbi:MAG: sensor histidine kinase [Spirochaetota bacterium]